MSNSLSHFPKLYVNALFQGAALTPTFHLTPLKHSCSSLSAWHLTPSLVVLLLCALGASPISYSNSNPYVTFTHYHTSSITTNITTNQLPTAALLIAHTPSHQNNEWIRDLTEEGIEPHPGLPYKTPIGSDNNSVIYIYIYIYVPLPC
jgi:hypothetical protein